MEYPHCISHFLGHDPIPIFSECRSFHKGDRLLWIFLSILGSPKSSEFPSSELTYLWKMEENGPFIDEFPSDDGNFHPYMP
jgi:hypothetical protein